DPLEPRSGQDVVPAAAFAVDERPEEPEARRQKRQPRGEIAGDRPRPAERLAVGTDDARPPGTEPHRLAAVHPEPAVEQRVEADQARVEPPRAGIDRAHPADADDDERE